MPLSPVAGATRKLRIPVVGQSFAGKGEVFGDDILAWREVDEIRNARPTDEFFCSTVYGDSLESHGIEEGDYLIVRIDRHAHMGDLIVANTPNGRIVKVLMDHIDRNRVRLLSGNPKYKTLVMDKQDVRIVGVVCRVERDLIIDGREVVEIVREYGDSRKPYRFQYF